jgi:uncharacterized protein YtpQ (UPF0354 family)
MVFSCPGCQHKIRPYTGHAILLFLVVAIALFGLLAATESLGLKTQVQLVLVVILTLGFEVLYFQLLRSGKMGSNLVDASDFHLQQAETAASNSVEALAAQVVSQVQHPVIPRLKRADYVESMRQVEGMDEANMPLTDPLFGDLILSYALDIGEHFMALSQVHLEPLNIGELDWRHDCKLNCLNALAKLEHHKEGRLRFMQAPDSMTACTVLFPELWDQVMADFALDPVIAVLHRDLIVYADKHDAQAMAELQHYVDTFEGDHHSLSKLLYQRHGASWQVYPG